MPRQPDCTGLDGEGCSAPYCVCLDHPRDDGPVKPWQIGVALVLIAALLGVVLMLGARP